MNVLKYCATDILQHQDVEDILQQQKRNLRCLCMKRKLIKFKSKGKWVKFYKKC